LVSFLSFSDTLTNLFFLIMIGVVPGLS
jgi:hypothetical protein